MMQAIPGLEAGYERVFLQDIAVEMSLGLHPWERHPERPQRVLVNVELFAPPRPAGSDRYIDYDRVRNAVLAWRTRPHVELIETLLDELVAVAFAHPDVVACRVSVAKPDIFNETRAAGVEFFRTRRGATAA